MLFQQAKYTISFAQHFNLKRVSFSTAKIRASIPVSFLKIFDSLSSLFCYGADMSRILGNFIIAE